MAPKVRIFYRLALVTLLVFFSYEVGRRLVGWNFHTVLQGRVYRGAQPSQRYVEMLANDHGVRTIINLRGCGLPGDWYEQEAGAVQHLGMNLEDVSFSAMRLPSSLELRRLVEIMDRTEFPVFIHCRRGADRTGMASVILMLLQTDQTLPEARKELGLWYGHIALSKTGVLNRFFDLYEEWLARQLRAHDNATFRHWILDEYKGGWCSAQFEEFTPLATEPRRGEPIGYRVRVKNTGSGTWHFRTESLSGMHLGYQVYDGEHLVAEGRAGMCDQQVPSGDTITITLVIAPLPKAGYYRLLADMVEEQHCWFYQAGSEPHEEEFVLVE